MEDMNLHWKQDIILENPMSPAYTSERHCRLESLIHVQIIQNFQTHMDIDGRRWDLHQFCYVGTIIL